MKTSDVFLTLFILLCFLGLYFANILAIGMKNIQNNWPKYRCNPSVMPFANMFGHDVTTNFTYCVQNMQSNYMDTLLAPVHYLQSVSNTNIGNITDSLNYIREFINDLRNNITSGIQSIFGVFLNMLIEVQKITMKIKDMMAKTIGINASMLYMLDGSIKTAQSTWNGPIGGTIRALK